MVKYLHAVFFFTSLNTQMLIYHIYKVLVKIQFEWNVFMVLYFMEHGEHSGFLIFIPYYGLTILEYFFVVFPLGLALLSPFSQWRLFFTWHTSIRLEISYSLLREKIERPSSLELRCVYLYVCPFLILIPILTKSRIWDLDI